MIESPPSPVYPLRPDIEDYFAPTNSNKLREPNRLGGGGGGSGGRRGWRICLRRSKSRSSWAVDLLAADFPAVGTMRADETSAGAVVDVQRHSPSAAAGEQSRWHDEASAMAAPSEGRERVASGSPMTNEMHNTRFQPCLA
jgi:hypothetical protein